jgi:predicted peroxiredoxin
MSVMNIIVATADGGRFYAALEAAMAWAALGRGARIFLQGEAVAMLREPIGYAGDAARKAAGQPDLAWMIKEAEAMDVGLTACQTGMAMVGMTAENIDARIKMIGLISFLAEVASGDDVVVF